MSAAQEIADDFVEDDFRPDVPVEKSQYKPLAPTGTKPTPFETANNLPAGSEAKQNKELSGVPRGVANAYTLGLEPQLAGVAGGAATKLAGGDFTEGYREARDAEKAKNEQSAKDAPIGTGAGALIGSAIPNPLSVLGKIGQGAKGIARLKALIPGLVQGGVAGLANSKADFTKGETPSVSEVAVPAGIGALFSGLLGQSGTGQGLEDASVAPGRRALRGLTGAGSAKEPLSAEAIKGALANKHIGYFSDVIDNAQSLQEARTALGQAHENLLMDMEKAGYSGSDAFELAKEFDRQAANAEKTMRGGSPVPAMWRAEAEHLRSITAPKRLGVAGGITPEVTKGGASSAFDALTGEPVSAQAPGPETKFGLQDRSPAEVTRGGVEDLEMGRQPGDPHSLIRGPGEVGAGGARGAAGGGVSNPQLGAGGARGAPSAGAPQIDTGVVPEHELGLVQAEKLKRSNQEAARTAYDAAKDTESGRAREALAALYREANDRAVQSQASASPAMKDLADKFIASKAKLAPVIEASDVANAGANRMMNRGRYGVLEYMGGLGSLASGHAGADPLTALKAAAALEAAHQLKTKGPSFVARGLYDTGQAVKGFPDIPPELAATLARAAALRSAQQ